MAITDPSEFSWTEGWGHAEPTGRDRREAERVMAYWESKLRELGGEVTVAGLDLNRINSKDWSNRFLIAVDPPIAGTPIEIRIDDAGLPELTIDLTTDLYVFSRVEGTGVPPASARTSAES